MTRLLYEKHVPADALLAPLFASMTPGYPQREAAQTAAAFGGPVAAPPSSRPEAAGGEDRGVPPLDRIRFPALRGVVSLN
ncbi:MAG TPA: hypothetical protein VMK84_16160 [Streptosporangiaceae bacterium]|nr:hypothetical protein [Streptosporangiaceae bacterium]